MKDEIKEILDYFKRSNKNKLGFEQDKIITYKEANKLLDYITNLQEENKRLLKTQEMYEKKCNKIHNYILQNCEIIRHKDYDEVGKVNGRHILTLLAGGE